MPQTRDDLEAELRLANENVERLLTAIASTPPSEITVRSYGGLRLRLKPCKAAPLHFSVTNWGDKEVTRGNLGVSEAHALRDWLNHYFPAATS